MAKKVEKKMKLQIRGGQANPAPPLGPALGGAGINIGEFVNQFNDRTKDQTGEMVSVVLNVYEDRSFDFVLKTPPTSSLIKKLAGVPKGSGRNKVKKVGKLTDTQVKEIAEIKMPDINAKDMEGAMQIVKGQARSMGIETE